MSVFGLVGKNIAYSFSKGFFTAFFEQENLNHEYVNFDIRDITAFPGILKMENLKGLNVTIPYKQQIIPYLDELDEEATAIGAVNTIKVHPSGKLTGYNTDHFGFAKSLTEHFPLTEKTALILGTGGASKAVAYALEKLGFTYRFVSRDTENADFSYQSLTEDIINNHKLIINCTPLGTSPNTDAFPEIPYQAVGKTHLLFDLIYNPAKTVFLKKGHAQGARTVNGQKMLEYQAMRSWEIWNECQVE